MLTHRRTETSPARPRRTVALALLACALAAPMIGADTAGVSRAVGPSKGEPGEGKKLFAAKCVACHKANGSGGIRLTGNPTPNWRDAKRMSNPKHDDDYLRDCMTRGKIKSGMQPVATLGVKPAEIEHLISYIRTFSRR